MGSPFQPRVPKRRGGPGERAARISTLGGLSGGRGGGVGGTRTRASKPLLGSAPLQRLPPVCPQPLTLSANYKAGGGGPATLANLHEATAFCHSPPLPSAQHSSRPPRSLPPPRGRVATSKGRADRAGFGAAALGGAGILRIFFAWFFSLPLPALPPHRPVPQHRRRSPPPLLSPPEARGSRIAGSNRVLSLNVLPRVVPTSFSRAPGFSPTPPPSTPFQPPQLSGCCAQRERSPGKESHPRGLEKQLLLWVPTPPPISPQLWNEG